MSSLSGLQIGLSGLVAQQLMQDTISHNIANANTPGYTRRDVVMTSVQAPDPYSQSPQSGQGVRVATIRRSASLALNQQIQDETSTLSYWQDVSRDMQTLSGIFQEPSDNGLGEQLNQFWTAWQDLAGNPTDSGNRETVLAAGQTLASGLNDAQVRVNDFVIQQEQALRLQVEQFNTLTSQVAGLNKQISQAPGGGSANDLLDQRDQALDALSSLAQIRTAESADGSITVAVGGHVLVAGTTATGLAVRNDAQGHAQLAWTDDGAPATVSAGEIGASLSLRDWAANEVAPDLQQMAGQLVTSVNEAHHAAYGLDNQNGRDFFMAGASGIAVNPDLLADSNLIGSAAQPGQPGDGSAAVAIAGLQRTRSAALGDTINDFYANLVARLGLDAQGAQSMSDNQDGLVRFLQGERDDLSSVSLNEEAVKMTSAQRAYEASARVITAMDQMLDVLINSTGMVGR